MQVLYNGQMPALLLQLLLCRQDTFTHLPGMINLQDFAHTHQLADAVLRGLTTDTLT